MYINSCFLFLFYICFFIFTVFFNKSELYAQQVKLEDVIVKGYPVRDSVIKDFSLNKITIGKKEISKTHYFDVTDVLKQLTGLNIVSEGTFGNRRVGDGRIKIRGNNAKLLIDGRPVSMEVFNCIVGNVMTLNNVEKIEVIKGGESVLYGSDGIGGIINIITEMPEKYKTAVTANFGSFTSKSFYLSTQNKIENFYYSAGYDLKRTDGDIVNTRLKSNDYFLKTGYEFSKHFTAEISGKYYDGDFDDPYELVDWDIDRKGLNINIRGDISKNNYYSVQYGLKRGEHKSYYLSGGNLKFHSRDFLDEFRSYQNINFSRTKIIYGFDYRNYGGQILNQVWAHSEKKSADEYAPYFSVNQKIKNMFDLTAGLRYNHNSLYHGIYLPKFGLVKNIHNKWKFGISANKSFRTPSSLQAQINKFAGNSELNPEQSWTYELNTGFKKENLISIDFSIFKIEGKDRIINQSGKFRNIDKYKHYGMEMEFTKQIISEISGTAGYSYIYTGKDTINQFRNKINFLVEYKKEKFNAVLNGIYVNKLYAGSDKTLRLPDYTKIDLKCKYEYNSALNFVVELDNILNKKYSMSYDDGVYTGSSKPIWSPGFGIFAGIETVF
ncbi:TonB-dependent receptor [Candidatus Dependentiae bacterium]|nr:TonB-dependent receptor [Candidatus Dependentiae bacterium]